jgi:hypothetical protein
MRWAVVALLWGLASGAALFITQGRAAASEDEYAVLLERLRKESPGEYAKVVELAKTDRLAVVLSRITRP